MNKTYVIGHKNPDTDAISAAMAYAEYKHKLGEEVIAARLGPVNEETKFAMKTFGIKENPPVILDARSTLSEIELDKAVEIDGEYTCNEAFNEVVKTNNKTLFVCDNHKLQGIASISDLTSIKLRRPEERHWLLSMSSIKQIARDLDAEIICEYEYKCTGRVYIYTTRKTLERHKDSILLIDSNAELERCLEEKPNLVIYSGDDLDMSLVERYREAEVSLIRTSKSIVIISENIYFSIPVKLIMSKNIVVCHGSDYVNEVVAKIYNTRFRCYPVVDEEGKLLGSLSRYHLSDYEKKKFILVDHSSKIQTIDNIDQAEIVEIVDHHHIGGIQTTKPINYINQTRGATCSIIYSLYKDKGLKPSKAIAGMMLSAIISDTMFFKSKTTRDIDIENARELAQIAGVNLEEYAVKLLQASVNLESVNVKDLIKRDLKEYKLNGYKVAIGQTNYDDISVVQSRIAEFGSELNAMQKAKNYDLLVMMFSSVRAEGSAFVFYGPKSAVMLDIIQTKFDANSGFDKRIISRKQQLVPRLSAKLEMY